MPGFFKRGHGRLRHGFFSSHAHEGCHACSSFHHNTLASLEPGNQGKIMNFVGKGRLLGRLLEMGIVPGTIVKVERIAPLGDPIEIKIRGYNLSLRRCEADKIIIEKIA